MKNKDKYYIISKFGTKSSAMISTMRKVLFPRASKRLYKESYWNVKSATEEISRLKKDRYWRKYQFSICDKKIKYFTDYWINQY